MQSAWGRLAFRVVPSLIATGLAAAGVWRESPWSTIAGASVAIGGAVLNPTGVLQPFFAFAAAGFLLAARWMAPQHRATRIVAALLGAVALVLLVSFLPFDAPYCESCYWWPWQPWRTYVVWVLPLVAIVATSWAPPWRPLFGERRGAPQPGSPE